MITNRLDLDHERSSQDLYMKAQRRRYNHLATTWTHSPRWNYSRIMPERRMGVGFHLPIEDILVAEGEGPSSTQVEPSLSQYHLASQGPTILAQAPSHY